jgi:hypothetical protein
MFLENKTTYLHFYVSKEQKNLFNFYINPHIVISNFQVQHSSFHTQNFL